MFLHLSGISYLCHENTKDARNAKRTDMGMLYVVPTPVGNLEDMTFRAVRILKEADLILAEDTRTSGILLRHYDIHGEVLSHHKFNEHETASRMADRIEGGLNVALISDAGTPGISDPGHLLVRECAARGIAVQTLPGATAFVPALVSSALPCDRFCFEGFLPPKKGRQSRLEALRNEGRSIVLYESPRRLLRTLQALAETFGEQRRVSVAREISKLHEEHVRGTLGEAIAHFTHTEPLGEIVIVVEGAPQEEKNGKHAPEEVDDATRLLMGTGKRKNKYADKAR